MAWKFADRTAESTVTVGTGDIMLAGAIDTDHDTFGNQFADADTMPVVVFGGGKWMTFEGRYNSGANSITRINFRDSSTGSPIALSGTMTAMCAWGATDAVAAAVLAAAAVRTDAAQSFTSSQQLQARSNIAAMSSSAAPRGQIFGLIMSNNATDAVNDIDIAAGEAASTDTSAVLMVLASAMTKRLDAAWAVGSGNGGRMSAAAIGDGTYHIWLIQRSDTGVVDVGFDVSATSPTMPTNYDRKRRIGSIIRESGAIVAFIQDGDVFRRKAITFIGSVNNPGTGDLSVNTLVPTGLSLEATIIGGIVTTDTTNPSFVLFTPLDQTSVAPTGSLSDVAEPGFFAGGVVSALARLAVRTSTTGQIRVRVSYSSSLVTITLSAIGWTDRRGRDG